MTALAWLFVLAGFVSLDARIIAPILPAVADTLGVTPGEAGLAMTAYTFTYGLMQLVYGPLSDRYGRIPIIQATALLFAAGSLLSGLAESLVGFVAARLLTGIFAAATIPTTFTYIGDTVPYQQRQTVVGRLTVVLSGAQALSATLAGTVTHYVSWRLLFVAYAFFTLAIVLGMGRPQPRRPVAGLDTSIRYADIVRMAHALRVYGAAFAEGFFIWGGSTYLGVLASARFGFNDLQIGVLIAAYGAGTIAGGLGLARLAPRVGERALARAGGWLQAVGFLLLAIDVPWPVFAIALAGIGVGLAWLHSTLQTRGTELVPAARGKAFSIFALAFFLGGAAGTAALGRLVDAGLIDVAMALCAVGLVAIGHFVARKR